MDGSKIIQHLVDISKGACSITEESILKLDNREDQMIEFGLLTLFEEVGYNKKRLENSVKDKEVLLKEIHHRVKNNLQIISSLLNLQTESIYDEKAKLQLQDCRSRVRTMSLLHEKLLRTKNPSGVNYKDYLEELVEEMKSANSHTPKDLNVRLDIDSFNLALDTAIPLGLIINEIFTNSLKHGLNKHGLNKHEKNEIYVQVKKVGPQSFEMKIGDNGAGYSDDIFNTEKNTLGVQLIRDLTAQIDGTIKKVSKLKMKGTHYQIRFAGLDT
jgi:two-component sensor histidine kinase